MPAISKTINYLQNIYQNLYANHFKKSIIGIAIIIASIIALTINKNEQVVYGEAKVQDITKSVTITGTVIAKEESALSFEKAGKIENINVTEGDKVIKGQTLANINMANDYATLTSAEGTYENALANLNDINKGPTDIELKIKEENVVSNTNNLLLANSSAVDTARIIYSGVFDIINNKLSSLFNYNGINYTLNKNSCNQALASKIENKRKELDTILKDFDTYTRNFILNNDNTNINIEADNKMVNSLSDSATYMTRQASFMVDDLNELYSSSCSINDTSSNEIKTIISNNKKTLESIVGNLNTTKSQILTYRNNYKNSVLLLEQTKDGATEQKIKSLSALVKNSKGIYENAKANYNKNFIFAPFDGIITKVNINKGETSSPNTVAINIISDNDYEIKAKLTETDLNKVKVADKAKITFDAFGDNVIYEGEISYIEESSTKEGNNNYYYAKISLTKNDIKVKPGMNAEIKVITETKANVLTIPNKYIMYKDNKYIVKKYNNKNTSGVSKASEKDFVDGEIKTGIIGDNGDVEVLEGLELGDKLYPIDETSVAKIVTDNSSPMNNAINERKEKTVTYNK